MIVLPTLLGCFFLLYIIRTYNRLTQGRNHCEEAWSNIDTELTRRHTLIPNLVNTVKGFADHEKQLLTDLTRLRESCMAAAGHGEEKIALENQLGHALQTLMVRMENYPDVKSSANFLDLQKELVNTEDRIQAARRFYNGNVRELNNRVQSFPGNLLAATFGFESQTLFEAESPEIRTAPSVNFTKGG